MNRQVLQALCYIRILNMKVNTYLIFVKKSKLILEMEKAVCLALILNDSRKVT